jgi:chemotaxis protein MotB
MARKRRQEEHENHERWLVSYADFITLLFAFFVVMYAVSSVNEGKYKVLSDSLTNAFSNTSGKAGGQPINVIQGAPPLSPRPGRQDGALARAEKE